MHKAIVLAGIALSAASAPAFSQTCTGNCGTGSPNGVVTAPPGGGNYQYVSTNGGANGAGQISTVGGTNGSEYITAPFAASANDALNFNFNYVTSDGAGFSDYAFAELLWAELTRHGCSRPAPSRAVIRAPASGCRRTMQR